MSQKREGETQTEYALRLVREQAREETLAEVAAFLDFEGMRGGYTVEALETDLAAYRSLRK